jgi:peptidoglycan LD-endopeptidase LytH
MFKKNNFPLYLSYAFVIILLWSCAGNHGINSIFNSSTPYQKYQKSLEQSGLSETELGQAWLKAGDDALKDSLTIITPYREVGYFAASNPRAAAYRFSARRGEKISISTTVNHSEQSAQLFTDLFMMERNAIGEEVSRLLSSGDTSTKAILYEVIDDVILLIRIQPELLKNVRYNLLIEKSPQLGFPVSGKSNIGSLWGDPRDGGKRKHQGIDIFAPKGTPVLAIADGYVNGVNLNNLGGKVVWVSDLKRKQTYYYAHLDTQLVRSGQRVKPGDTLGLVGNTGNAKHTPPHLHFGIYKYMAGAIDPLPFVDNRTKNLSEIKTDLNVLGEPLKIAANTANIRLSPDTKSPVICKVDKNTSFITCSGTNDWYCITLPDNTKGFVHQSLIDKRNHPIKTQSTIGTIYLFDNALEHATIIDTITKGSKIKVMGKFGHSNFVETDKGLKGWIRTG